MVRGAYTKGCWIQDAGWQGHAVNPVFSARRDPAFKKNRFRASCSDRVVAGQDCHIRVRVDSDAGITGKIPASAIAYRLKTYSGAAFKPRV